MAYACDKSNKCVTDSLDHDKTPYKMWHGRPPAFDTLLPFGTVVYRRVEKPAHKLASRGAKCVLLGTAGPHDVKDHRHRGSFRVRDFTTDAIICRQAVTWNPAAGAGGDTPVAATSGRGMKGDENHSPQIEEPAVRMGTLGAELGSEEQVASGESRQIPEGIPLEPELPEEPCSLQSFRRCKQMLMSRRRGWEGLRTRSRSRTGGPSSRTHRLL